MRFRSRAHSQAAWAAGPSALALAAALLGGGAAQAQDKGTAAPREPAATSDARAESHAPRESATSMRVIQVLQMDWRIESCFRSQPQQVTCKLSVNNTAGDKRISFDLRKVRMIDSSGTEYQARSGGFGQNETTNPTFANGVNTIGVFRFDGVDPKASSVARFGFFGDQQSVGWSNVSLGGSGSGGGGRGLGSRVKEWAGLKKSDAATDSSKPGESKSVTQSVKDAIVGKKSDASTDQAGNSGNQPTEKKRFWEKARDKAKEAVSSAASAVKK